MPQPIIQSNEVVRYIRKHNKPVGVLMAVFQDDKSIRYGYSLCGHGDAWSKKTGVAIARSRANSKHYEKALAQAPQTVRKHLESFAASLEERHV